MLNWKHNLWAQSQGHHTIDHLKEREIVFTQKHRKRKRLMIIFERAIVNHMNIGTVWKAVLWKLLKNMAERMYGFFLCVNTICLFLCFCVNTISLSLSLSLSLSFSPYAHHLMSQERLLCKYCKLSDSSPVI